MPPVKSSSTPQAKPQKVYKTTLTIAGKNNTISPVEAQQIQAQFGQMCDLLCAIDTSLQNRSLTNGQKITQKIVYGLFRILSVLKNSPECIQTNDSAAPFQALDLPAEFPKNTHIPMEILSKKESILKGVKQIAGAFGKTQ